MTSDWHPPVNWQRITTIDAHTAGEPLRVITGGLPPIPGDTILEKRRFAIEHLDQIRTALMWEPRGHADMYGCIITEPVTKDGTFGILFLHNDGFSTMCGHGIIGIAKVALDTGLIKLSGDDPIIRMDTPAGRVTAVAHRENGIVQEVSFENVPSFVYALDQVIDVPGIGRVRYDIAFGGAFYAFCRADELGVGLSRGDIRQLIDAGRQIKQAINDTVTISHPYEEDLGFLYGTIFIGPAREPTRHSRNVCIFADGEVDRCPTGTGVSARMAIHYARGEIDLNEPLVIESILGTAFTAEIVGAATFGPYDAIIPRVTGSAFITGRNEFLIDPNDLLKDGFLLR